MKTPLDTQQRDALPIVRRHYGHEQELERLRSSFQRVQQGNAELVLLTGKMGVGKSGLIREFVRTLPHTKRNFLLRGKCAKLQRHTPYYPFKEAIEQLVKSLTHSDLTEQERTYWQERVQHAVGQSGALLTRAFPALEQLIGEQPSPPEVDIRYTVNRFNTTFQRFIRVFTEEHLPFILIIDDLQWADHATLDLIAYLTTRRKMAHFLFIGAYQTLSTDTHHTLSRMMQSLPFESHNRQVSLITLSGLSVQDIEQLLRDTLGTTSAQSIQAFAELLHRKSSGFPFFIRHYLRLLNSMGALAWDDISQTWRWDIRTLNELDEIRTIESTIADQVERLPQSTLDFLKVAACIGRTFDRDTIAAVQQQMVDEIYNLSFQAIEQHLRRAFNEGLIHYSTDQGYYKFVHRHGRRAILSHSSTVFRQKAHLRIGRVRYSQLRETLGAISLTNPFAWPIEEVFTIVAHWNIGLTYVQSKVERSLLLELNLIAAKQAISMAAYKDALNILETAGQLIYHDIWHSDYQIMCEWTALSMEVALLHQSYQRLEQHFQESCQYVHYLPDQVRHYELMIQGLVNQNRAEEAIALSKKYLRALGIAMPNQDTRRSLIWAVVRIFTSMATVKPTQLAARNGTLDTEQRAAMRIIHAVSITLYLVGHRSMILYIDKALQYTRRYGLTPYTTFSLSGYSLLLSLFSYRRKRALHFAEFAAHHALSQYDYTNYSMLTLVAHTLISHKQNHIQASLTPLEKSYQYALETGNTALVMYNGLVYLYLSVHSGLPLSQCRAFAEGFQNMLRLFESGTQPYRVEVYPDLVNHLMSGTHPPLDLDDTATPETSTNLRMAAVNQRMADVMSLFIFGEYESAATLGWRIKSEVSQYFKTSYLGRVFVFYFTLSLCQALRVPQFYLSGERTRNQVVREIINGLRYLRKWSLEVHANFLHKYHLANAMYHIATDNEAAAQDLFRKAYLIADKEEFTHEVGIIAEQAFIFFKSQGDEATAAQYAEIMRQAYTHWEAWYKLDTLRQQWGLELT